MRLMSAEGKGMLDLPENKGNAPTTRRPENERSSNHRAGRQTAIY